MATGVPPAAAKPKSPNRYSRCGPNRRGDIEIARTRAGFQRKPSKMGPDGNAALGLIAFRGHNFPATQP
jgi:hypothetical protein